MTTATRTKAPPRKQQTHGVCPTCEGTIRCTQTGVLSTHNRRFVVKDKDKIRLWLVQAGQSIEELPSEVLYQTRCAGSGAQLKEWTT